MHDDVFLVMNAGWASAAKPREARIVGKTDAGANKYEDVHLKRGVGRNTERYAMDLVPPTLIVARYFAGNQSRVDELITEAEAATQAVEEYTEEHGMEDGLVWDAVNDKGKLTQAAVKAELKVAKELGDDDGVAAFAKALDLLSAEAAAKKAATEAQAALDTATLKKYSDQSEASVQSLVLEEKWAATIRNRVVGEVNALTLGLVNRIQQLGKRYADTVGAIDAELEKVAAKVAGHLARMGVAR
jgi:type I restriction enzyme M protein